MLRSLDSSFEDQPTLERADNPETLAPARRPIETRDLDLVAAVLRKDRKASAEFASRHIDAVYGYLRSRLIPRVELVDDLVQDVFLAAWEHLREYRGSSSLQSWLLGIARHKVEDYYRGRLREGEPLEGEDAVAAGVQTEPQFDELIDQERACQKVRRVLETLPEAYSVVLLWRYWEKQSTREIALRTGRTEKAIERLLARARQQFKQRWIDV